MSDNASLVVMSAAISQAGVACVVMKLVLGPAVDGLDAWAASTRRGTTPLWWALAGSLATLAGCGWALQHALRAAWPAAVPLAWAALRACSSSTWSIVVKLMQHESAPQAFTSNIAMATAAQHMGKAAGALLPEWVGSSAGSLSLVWQVVLAGSAVCASAAMWIPCDTAASAGLAVQAPPKQRAPQHSGVRGYCQAIQWRVLLPGAVGVAGIAVMNEGLAYATAHTRALAAGMARPDLRAAGSAIPAIMPLAVMSVLSIAGRVNISSAKSMLAWLAAAGAASALCLASIAGWTASPPHLVLLAGAWGTAAALGAWPWNVGAPAIAAAAVPARVSGTVSSLLDMLGYALLAGLAGPASQALLSGPAPAWAPALTVHAVAGAAGAAGLVASAVALGR